MPYSSRRGSSQNRFSPYTRASSKASQSSSQSPATRLIGKAADISVPNEYPYRFDFGKHNGKSIKEVVRKNGSYIGFLTIEKVYEENPALSDALNWATLYKAKIERIKQEATDTVDTEEDHPYKFTFGKHQGKTIKEVWKTNGGYIGFLKQKKIYWTDPEVDKALRWLNKHKERIRRKQEEDLAAYEAPTPPIKADYKLPKLASAPSHFLTDDDPTWITGSDAIECFGLDYTHLQYLEDHNGTLPESSKYEDRPPSKKRYLLYQVYGICKAHISEAAANVGFLKFEAKSEERMDDIWASMGLGICLS